MFIIYILIAILLLWFAADWLVDGAANLAENFSIRPLIIGLTIISFGTSAPELLVSLVAANDGHTSMALGNVVGSNICNVALVLGVSALINPLSVQKSTVKKEIPFMLVLTAVTILIAWDLQFNYIDGIILFAFILFFTGWMFLQAKHQKEDHDKAVETGLEDDKEDEGNPGKAKNLMLIVFGSIGLIIGARLMISGSKELAELIGLPKIFISLTLIAFGTSLPELAASAMASYKKQSDLCIGNIVGSNIFNLGMVLGITAMVAHVPVEKSILTNEFIWLAVISILLLIMSYTEYTITKREGAVLLVLYCFFIYSIYKPKAEKAKADPVTVNQALVETVQRN